MSRAQAGFALLLLTAILGLEVYSSFMQTPEPEAQTRWEYRIESPSDYSFTREMNDLGEQGWELVFARRALDSSTDDYSYEVILKRPSND
jgi:hypothetical protein